MEPLKDEVRKKIIEYFARNGDSLDFTRYFWRGCEPLQRDVEFYSEFVQAVCNHDRGVDSASSSRQVGVGFGSTRSWSTLDVMPKLGHYLRAFLELGEPARGSVWLNTDCSHGQAIPIGQFVQVPSSIEDWKDVEPVVSRLDVAKTIEVPQTRAYMFGFFMGVMLGDAAKKNQGRGHKHVTLVLSKKYDTNLKIGDYTCVCAQRLGLRMHRLKDIHSRNKPFGFYQWSSQSSPLIDWLFQVALGLDEGQLTTYDPIKADWMLSAPSEFRLGLIQGIAESDGSVSVASQEVEFWIGPNWDWMIKLLQTFQLKGFANREAVTLSKSQAIASFGVPVFAEQLRTVRYQRLELMAKSRRLEKRERLPLAIRAEIMNLTIGGESVPKIVESIARSHGILVSFEAAQRWAKKTGKYQPKGSRKDPEEDSS